MKIRKLKKYKPTKFKLKSLCYNEKIDGIIATIMALDRAIRCGNSNTASVYDERDIVFVVY